MAMLKEVQTAKKTHQHSEQRMSAIKSVKRNLKLFKADMMIMAQTRCQVENAIQFQEVARNTLEETVGWMKTTESRMERDVDLMHNMISSLEGGKNIGEKEPAAAFGDAGQAKKRARN